MSERPDQLAGQIVSSTCPVEIFPSDHHGEGVRSIRSIPPLSQIFAEMPCWKMQTLSNKQDCICCSFCLRFLGSPMLQLQVLGRQLNRQQLVTQLKRHHFWDESSSTAGFPHSDIVSCCQDCGEFYCSFDCRDNHWNTCHQLLCTGSISDIEAESHPLILFKMHAIETNEIFLLVSDIFANLCLEYDRDVDAMNDRLKTFNRYVRNRWEDCAVAPPHQNQEELKETLTRLVKESWALLSSALKLQERKLDQLLDEDFLSRTIGMFEQNNVGIRLKNPLLEYLESLKESSEGLLIILNLLKAIKGATEGN